MSYLYTSFQRQNLKKRVRLLALFISSQFFLPLSFILAAPLLTLLLVPYLEMVHIEAIRTKLEPVHPYVLTFVFSLSALYLVLFNIPIWYDVLKGGVFSDRSKRRVLASPLHYGLVVFFGGLLSFFTITAYLLLEQTELPRGSIPYNLAFNLISGILVMSILYSVIEILNRRYFLKIIFTDGLVSPYSNDTTASFMIRFFNYFIAVSIFPTMVLSLGLYNSNERLIQGGLAPLASNGYLIVTQIAIVTSGIIITWLLTTAIAPTVEQLQIATRRIREGDLQVELPVSGGDSLGLLTESINTMAASLREKEFIVDIFGRVVDPSVRDHLIKGEMHTTGQTRRVTILFSDIRNFTGFSERNSPERIVYLLNRYFEKMSEVITAESGLVNKFIGDAIMAIFNAPLDCHNHETAAMRAAMRMIEERNRLNQELIQEGYDPIRTGIGIHTGEVLAGNIGSRTRMEYTVIGDAVNVASRLESFTKKAGREIVISDETYGALQDDFPLDRVARVQVKGRSAPIEVYGLSH